LFLQHQSW
jgi:hypothetical protein